MLCSDAQCCYNSSCGYRLFPCFVVCCVVMYNVAITAPVLTDFSMFCRMLCSDAQCCYNSSCGYRLFPCFVVCCVVMHSVVITAPVVTDFSHVLTYVV